MPIDTIKSAAEEYLNPLAFADGLYDGAIGQPIKAVRQLAGQEVETDHHSRQSFSTQAGHLAGFIVDFAILSKLTGGLANKICGKEAAASALGHTARSAFAGGVYGGMLTVSPGDKDLLQSRFENAAINATTFGVMGGTAHKLESLGVQNALGTRIWTNALSGVAGGAIDSYSRALLSEGRLANTDEVIKSASYYAAFGAGFGALDHGLTQLIRKVEPTATSSYYRAKWAIEEKCVDGKRLGYSILNKYNMRHPLRRLGDTIYGADHSPAKEPAPLTPENNPALLLEKDLTEYVRRIAEKEAILDRTTAWPERNVVIDQQKEIRIDFAHRLLERWHGTAEKPGFASYTDAELAAHGVPVERVASMRKALTTTAREDLANSVLELTGQELPYRPHAYDFSCEVAYGKERHFGYDETAIERKMAMPSILHFLDHEGTTPLSWVPFEPTPQMPNLFHGTVSHSLPLIFAERAMLPASELSLRGMTQATGECLGQRHLRRDVSITRDFTEAWAYHRHSPLDLTSYPVIFGASRSVAAKAELAGCLEPGELLVKRLSLGESWLTRLGIRKPEITHVYVPDSQVATVNKQLATNRVKGVNVIGFSELKTPEWINVEPPAQPAW